RKPAEGSVRPQAEGRRVTNGIIATKYQGLATGEKRKNKASKTSPGGIVAGAALQCALSSQRSAAANNPRLTSLPACSPKAHWRIPKAVLLNSHLCRNTPRPCASTPPRKKKGA